ncbi:hypothetical protein LCGC14_1291830 [marine sediment metagenome]|uniref:Uncharacterized protein n=1 Tax=marine sediment metagenome TaxID=412755 RepID=A0A0F9LD02_9ZZZZ
MRLLIIATILLLSTTASAEVYRIMAAGDVKGGFKVEDVTDLVKDIPAAAFLTKKITAAKDENNEDIMRIDIIMNTRAEIMDIWNGLKGKKLMKGSFVEEHNHVPYVPENKPCVIIEDVK